MAKFFNALRNIILETCNIFLIVQVIVIVIGVIGRKIFNKSPGWSEPVALLSMVWFCLLSATLVIKDDRHIRVTVIDYFIPERVKKYVDIFNDIVITAFALFMVIEGVKLTQLSALSIIAGLNIKSSWLFAAVPVAGAAFLIALIEKEVALWQKRKLQ